MILEMRTSRYVPGVTPKVNAAYEAGLSERSALSPLGGLFHVDVGVLNTSIELWPYQDEAERAEVLEKSGQLSTWPPAVQEIRIAEETIVLDAAPSNEEFTTGAFGKLYEIRIYHIVPGKMAHALRNWAEKIGPRAAMSPFIGLFVKEDDKTNSFVHIWAYDDGLHRSAIRAEAQQKGIWPPGLSADGLLVRQESVLAIPAPFSPLH